jgi:uncharacterized protein
MLLGILSDTHDEVARTRLAVQMLRDAGAEALVHCGDLSSRPIVEALAVLPAWFAFGNHDSDLVPLLKQSAVELGPVCLGWGGVFELSCRRIGVVHGHMSTDVRKVFAEEPEFMFSGHSHFPIDVMAGSVRRINPGALHRADKFTVAILDLASGKLQILRVLG